MWLDNPTGPLSDFASQSPRLSLQIVATSQVVNKVRPTISTCPVFAQPELRAKGNKAFVAHHLRVVRMKDDAIAYRTPSTSRTNSAPIKQVVERGSIDQIKDFVSEAKMMNHGDVRDRDDSAPIEPILYGP